MSTTRPFAYNTGSTIEGTIQVGTLSVGVSEQDYSVNPGGVKWWMGPDEDLGYVIAKSVPSNTQPTEVGVTASVGFERTSSKTDELFIELSNRVVNQGFTGATQASSWLTDNGYWNSYTGFGSSGFQWMTVTSVTDSTASGIGQNNITAAITQSGGGMGITQGVFNPTAFPEQYGVPFTGNQILNQNSGTFTATFSQPVTNALVAFASIGNGGLYVPIQVSAPFTPIFGASVSYQNPVNGTQYTQLTGNEGYSIIRIDGTVTSVTFIYTESEYYCNVCFGFVNQNNLPTPTPTPTNTVTPTSSVTPTQTPTNTVTPTNTPTNTVTPTQTETPTQTPTNTVTPTNTPTPSVTPTNTVTPTPTVTPTNTVTPTKTVTPTPTMGGLVSSGLVFNLLTAPSTGTTWTDASGNGYNATLQGTPTYVSNNGGGIRLNNPTHTGTDFISVPYNIGSTTSTIEIVASFNSTSYWAPIWANEAYNTSKGYFAYQSSSTQITWGSPTSNTTAATITASNAIRHWVFVINGTSKSLYLNGTQLGSTQTIGNPSAYATGNFYFGSRHGNDGTGSTDRLNNSTAANYPVFYQMRVYNTALSGAQITTNFNSIKGTYGL